MLQLCVCCCCCCSRGACRHKGWLGLRPGNGWGLDGCPFPCEDAVCYCGCQRTCEGPGGWRRVGRGHGWPSAGDCATKSGRGWLGRAVLPVQWLGVEEGFCYNGLICQGEVIFGRGKRQLELMPHPALQKGGAQNTLVVVGHVHVLDVGKVDEVADTRLVVNVKLWPPSRGWWL